MNFPTNLKQYKLLGIVGRGSTSTVFKVQCLTNNQIVALKSINFEACEVDLEAIHNEISLLNTISCENIVKYYGTFLEGSTLYIIMEYMSKGSCYDLLQLDQYKNGIPNEELIAYIVYSTLKALSYLHNEKKIHRDIKPGNILINENGDIKLTDLGIAASLIENGKNLPGRSTLIGTPNYMAPEILTKSKYQESADIWSLGITIIDLALGRNPFAGLEPLKIVSAIVSNPPPRLPQTFSPEIQDFAAQCLQPESSQRSPIEKLIHHMFFSHLNDTIPHSITILKNISSKALAPIVQISPSKSNSNAFSWDFTIKNTKSTAPHPIQNNNIRHTKSMYLPQINDSNEISNFYMNFDSLDTDQDQKIQSLTDQIKKLKERIMVIHDQNEKMRFQIKSIKEKIGPHTKP